MPKSPIFIPQRTRRRVRAGVCRVHRNAVSTTSPDAGSQSAQYDALGLPKRIVDALGQATSITRDALGRPTSIVHADGRSTTLAYDLTGAAYNATGFANASKGYLSKITDTTDTTVYLRDGFGRVIRKTQQLAPFATGTAKTSNTATPVAPQATAQANWPASPTPTAPKSATCSAPQARSAKSTGVTTL